MKNSFYYSYQQNLCTKRNSITIHAHHFIKKLFGLRPRRAGGAFLGTSIFSHDVLFGLLNYFSAPVMQKTRERACWLVGWRAQRAFWISLKWICAIAQSRRIPRFQLISIFIGWCTAHTHLFILIYSVCVRVHALTSLAHTHICINAAAAWGRTVLARGGIALSRCRRHRRRRRSRLRNPRGLLLLLLSLCRPTYSTSYEYLIFFFIILRSWNFYAALA